MNNSPICLAICLTDDGTERYLKAVAALYVSVRTRTQADLVIYLIHDDTIGDDAKGKLVSTLRAGDEIVFIDINDHPAVKQIATRHAVARYTPAVLWRLFLPDLIPRSKVLVCDADLIVLFDIGEIWSVDLGEHAFFAPLRGQPHSPAYHEIIQTPPEKYFRMTISVMNLRVLRTDSKFREGLVPFLDGKLRDANKIQPLPEQSVFNYFFHDRCLPMPVDIPQIAHLPRSSRKDPTVELYHQIRLEHPTVLDIKGWETLHPHDFFFWCYLLLTPWRAEAIEVLGRKTSRTSLKGVVRKIGRRLRGLVDS